MVNLVEHILGVLMVFSVLLSMYTARLVCNDPSFDRWNVPMISSLRKYAGCPSDAKQSTERESPRGQKDQPDSPAAKSYIPDATAPSWTKIVAALEKGKIWPKNENTDVIAGVSTKRVPFVLREAPINPLSEFDISIGKEDIGFWNIAHSVKRRADKGNMFAREVYTEDATDKTVQYPTGDSPSISPYFYTRQENLRELIQSIWAGKALGIAEFFPSDLEAMLAVPLDAFKAATDDAKKGNGSQTTTDSIEKGETMVTSVVEPPGAVMAAQMSTSHLATIQLVGTRNLLLFPPERWFDLHMYPLASPRRHLSMLDFVKATEKNQTVAALQVQLSPGDVLYVPPFWSMRTSVPFVPKEQLLPSNLSISAQVATFSSEHAVQAMFEKMSQLSELLKVVTMMAADDVELKHPVARSRAAAAWLVKHLYDKCGMDAKQSMPRLVKRFTSQAELQSDFLQSRQLQCVNGVEMMLLEDKARSVVLTFAVAVAQSKGMLAGSYENLDERFGMKTNRITAVWRIFVEEMVEKSIILLGENEYVELAVCIADAIARL